MAPPAGPALEVPAVLGGPVPGELGDGLGFPAAAADLHLDLDLGVGLRLRFRRWSRWDEGAALLGEVAGAGVGVVPVHAEEVEEALPVGVVAGFADGVAGGSAAGLGFE